MTLIDARILPESPDIGDDANPIRKGHQHMAKAVIGIDLGHDQLGRRRHGRRRAHRHRQPGGQPDHAVGRRLRQGRRAAGRAGRQAAGRHQPGEHGVLDQALHGPRPSRSGERGAPRAVPRRRRRQRRRGHRGARPALLAAGNLGDGPAEAEGGRGGLPRPAGRPTRSSPCRPTSTTRSARRPRTPAALPA